MSQDGTAKAELEQATAELQTELEKWRQAGLDPMMYRMNEQSLPIRCEILVLTEIIREQFGLSEDYVNAKLRRIFAEQIRLLLPEVQKLQKQAVHDAITDGVVPKSKVIQLRPDIKL